MANHSQDENEMDLEQISDRDLESSDNTDSESSDDSEMEGEGESDILFLTFLILCLLFSSCLLVSHFVFLFVTFSYPAELNEEECEKMKCEMTVDMTDLEKQFIALKEQLYYERLNRVDVKLTEVRAGKSIDYLQPLEELQENLRVRTEVAGVLRELRMENVKCIHEAERVAAQQHLEASPSLLFMSPFVNIFFSHSIFLIFHFLPTFLSQAECRAIADFIRQDLEEKLRRLEEDRNSIDSEAWNEASPGKRKKRFPPAGIEGGPIGRDQLNLPDRRRKPVSVSGPYIVYMLRESEILEDFNLIRKASRSLSSSSFYF